MVIDRGISMAEFYTWGQASVMEPRSMAEAFPFLKELRFQIKWDIDLHMPGR